MGPVTIPGFQQIFILSRRKTEKNKKKIKWKKKNLPQYQVVCLINQRLRN